MSVFTLALLVLQLSLQLTGSDATFSGSVICPCTTSLAASWEFTLEQAMLVSDVVMMGKVLELHEGLGGMMNATIVSMITYKGHFSHGAFLTRVDGITNFEKSAPREMALFFFAREPAGNLALQCMSLLTSLNAVSDLKAVLDFVRDIGSSKLMADALYTVFIVILRRIPRVYARLIMWCPSGRRSASQFMQLKCNCSRGIQLCFGGRSCGCRACSDLDCYIIQHINGACHERQRRCMLTKRA